MLKFVQNLVNWFEVKIEDRKGSTEFHAALHKLVSILFAVVFGVGLSKLGELKGIYDFAVLIIAYIAVLLSWWGYHWGTIKGPRETNVLDYAIDCLLVVVYWCMINIRNPIIYVLLCYSAMFFLYWAWEAVRASKQNMELLDRTKVRKAKSVNRLFFFLVLALLASRNLILLWDVIYIVILFILIFVYRFWIHGIYGEDAKPVQQISTDGEKLEEELVALAKDAAANARAPLSGYIVGAVILAASGKKYSGCNVEFENYSNTIHAEESAISSFVGAGEKEALMIAVYTDGSKVSFPCGMCRQSLFEIGGPKLKVIACTKTSREKKTIGELLPDGFRL